MLTMITTTAWVVMTLQTRFADLIGLITGYVITSGAIKYFGGD